jgi:glycyl-tRNA synthetase
LTQHQTHSGVKLVAEKTLPEPKLEDVAEVQVDKAAVGKQFKQKNKMILSYLEKLTSDQVAQLEIKLKEAEEVELDIDAENKFKIKSSLFTIKRYQRKTFVEEFVPSVIEPSFGVGRVLYSIWEHNFKQRENDADGQRTYFSLPPLIAPYKCCLLPLSSNAEFKPLIRELTQKLTNAGISHKVDDSSGSIGRRYARTDEIAIPFAITVDFDSISKAPHSVTLRERDSMQQIRINVCFLN